MVGIQAQTRGGWPGVCVVLAAMLLAGCLAGPATPAPTTIPVTPAPGSSPSPGTGPTPSAPPSQGPTQSAGPNPTPGPTPTATPTARPTLSPPPTAQPSPTPAGVAYVPGCDEANLRIAASTAGALKVSLGLRSTLTVHGSVAGSQWSVVCPGSKSGTSWAVISQINGVSVSSLYGVNVLYAASGLLVPAGSPSLLISNGRRTGNDVALTFDMGGRVGDALDVLNHLLSRAVPATIFMTGEIVDSSATSAGRQVLQVIQANPDEFTLGNHSYSHPYFTQISSAEMAEEVNRAAGAFAKHASQDPKPYFRPPYGASNSASLAGVGAAGYRLSVKWDIDTIDWRPIDNPGGPAGPTANQIVTKVLSNAQAGSIVLMHLGGFETLNALPRIIDGLRDRGFDLVNLDTMLGP